MFKLYALKRENGHGYSIMLSNVTVAMEFMHGWMSYACHKNRCANKLN